MPKLLNEAQLIAWVKRRLNIHALKLPLSDEQFEDAIIEAKQWFSYKKGVDREFKVYVTASQTEYKVPDDCDGIIDVAFQSGAFDLSGGYYPALPGEGIPYGVLSLAGGGDGGLYSGITQLMEYSELAKATLGLDNKWEWAPQKRCILLYAPESGAAIVQYRSTDLPPIEDMTEVDHTMIKRFALAWAKRDLGQLYSRYSSWPGADGTPTSLNGPQLLKEAQDEFDKLDQMLGDSSLPLPFLVG